MADPHRGGLCPDGGSPAKTAVNNARAGWLARLATYDHLAGRQLHLTQEETS